MNNEGIKGYSASSIFNGTHMLLNHAVLIANGWIIDVVPLNQVPSKIEVTHLSQPYLVPGFIDLQVYGASNKLFSLYPTAAALFALQSHCQQAGTLHFLPTVATNTYAIIYQCIDAIQTYWKQGGEGCLGLHIEGPWINKTKKGAHVESLIHAPTLQEVQQLIAKGKGVIKMITLAPEVCNDEVIKCIQDSGIIVSAGHSNATFEEANKAFAMGINTVTHLFNAMSGLQHKEPGLVGAAFVHDTVMAGIIADGQHVNFAAVQIACKQMQGRLFAITDAVTTATEGPYQHHFDGNKYTHNKILSGSAITMVNALQNLVTKVKVPLEEALKMITAHPAKVLNMHTEIGSIAKGCRAGIIALNADFSIATLP